MSTEELASQAKANGAEAWSTGKYDEAINYFTEAINHGGDKEFLRTLYSNRSAAYLKISNKEKALLDSEKCVSIDGNWSKGYVRKGDALLSLKKYTDAYNAYNSAARISPNDQSIKDKCEQAIRLMSSSSSSNSSSYSNNQSFSGTNGYNPSATVTGNGRIAKIMRYAKLATVVLAVGYVFPMRIVSTLCYRYFL